MIDECTSLYEKLVSMGVPNVLRDQDSYEDRDGTDFIQVGEVKFYFDSDGRFIKWRCLETGRNHPRIRISEAKNA